MTATTLLLTTERPQAQFIGVRGQWVISFHQQIARFLGARLSQSHVLLFAEPVVTANTIDWFTAAEGEIKPFAQLDEAGQAALLRQTQSLIADIQNLSQELNASAQSDQHLIGELLNNMLVFPDQNLFLVGTQPVVVGWGLKFVDSDLTWQVASVIQSKMPLGLDPGTSETLSGVRKTRQRGNQPAQIIARQRPPVSTSTAATETTGATADAPLPSASSATEDKVASSWKWVLWTGLLLLLVLLIAGLRGCDGLSFQWSGTATAVPDLRFFPPASKSTFPEPTDQLAATRQREYQLRQELARLQAELLVKRRACPTLESPRQISPKNGSVFGHYPRTTTLEWTKVSGANSYSVEIDCSGCCGTPSNAGWCAERGEPARVQTGIADTTFTFGFVGAQPGRWRVWAVDKDGRLGDKSDWWEFRYTK